MGQEIVEGSPDVADLPPGLQGNVHNLHITLFLQFHQSHSLLVRQFFFIQGIPERRPRIADGLLPHRLAFVDMAQCRVVKVFKALPSDLLYGSHRGKGGLGTRRFRVGRTGHELVSQDHVPKGRVDACPADHRTDGIIIVFDGFIREEMPDPGGLHEWQHPDMERSVFVRYLHMSHFPVIPSGNMDAAVFKDPAAEIEPLVGVMVPADHKDRLSGFLQLRQEGVQQCHCRFPRHRPVVHIPADHHPVHRLLFRNGQEPVQDEALVFDQIEFVQGLPQVKIP